MKKTIGLMAFLAAFSAHALDEQVTKIRFDKNGTISQIVGSTAFDVNPTIEAAADQLLKLSEKYDRSGTELNCITKSFGDSFFSFRDCR